MFTIFVSIVFGFWLRGAIAPSRCRYQPAEDTRPVTARLETGADKVNTMQVKSGYSESFQLKPLDKAGNETSFAEPAKWEAGDAAVISLTPSADGKTCKVVGLAVGLSKVTAVGIGAKGLPIIATGQVEVQPGDAVTAQLVESGDDAPVEEAPVVETLVV